MQPTIFCLHYLGGSAREWSALAEALRDRVRVVPIDLPGFGDNAAVGGYCVAEMADAVTHAVISHAPGSWILAGHSMGAKVAAVIGARARDGAPELTALSGLILIAGSPPSPEPMADEQRAKMLGWFAGDAATERAQAHEYVASNSGPKLSTGSMRLAEDDVLRCNRAAWTAWLESGSREDWAEYVGVLDLPTLLIAGADDENLGPDAQQRLTMPHLSHARLVTLAGAKHLLPMECTDELAALLHEHAAAIGYRELIASVRVSEGTRRALESRDGPDDAGYRPSVMTAGALATLRALADAIVPQDAEPHIDIAARIEKQLAAGEGDGWRFAALPADALAYSRGLETIEAMARMRYGTAFVHATANQRDELLQAIAQDKIGLEMPENFTPAQMKLWFEDLRADAVRMYLGHPRTLARIGYSGIANGGDGSPKSGFAAVGLGAVESWEPEAFSESVR